MILGKAGRSAVATLVEHTSRFLMLVELPKVRTAESVTEALVASMPNLPEALRRT